MGGAVPQPTAAHIREVAAAKQQHYQHLLDEAQRLRQLVTRFDEQLDSTKTAVHQLLESFVQEIEQRAARIHVEIRR